MSCLAVLFHCFLSWKACQSTQIMISQFDVVCKMSALVQTVAAARYSEIGWGLFQGIYAEKLGQPIRKHAI